MRMAAGAADLIISRAGAGTLSEIAIWEKPVIIVPIPRAIMHDQQTNAFAYARLGAGEVIEQDNLSAGLLTSEIARLMGDEEARKRMGEAAKQFAQPEAADKIAREILDLALEHEA